MPYYSSSFYSMNFNIPKSMNAITRANDAKTVTIEKKISLMSSYCISTIIRSVNMNVKLSGYQNEFK